MPRRIMFRGKDNQVWVGADRNDIRVGSSKFDGPFEVEIEHTADGTKHKIIGRVMTKWDDETNKFLGYGETTIDHNETVHIEPRKRKTRAKRTPRKADTQPTADTVFNDDLESMSFDV